jgi:tetratricopeptide (TPR) repeat protein
VTHTIQLQAERLKRLPIDSSDTWQGSVRSMPAVVIEGGDPVRPHVPLWVSTKLGIVHCGTLLRPGEEAGAALVDTLVAFALKKDGPGAIAGRLEVDAPQFVELLAAALANTGVEVILKDRLVLVDDLMESMGRHFGFPAINAGLLESVGDDLERVRRFADAAAQFYRARLWQHVDDEDPIRIESAVPEPELSWFVVMGASDIATGLAFFESGHHYDRFMRAERSMEEHLHSTRSWMLTFGELIRLPFPDSELWNAHDLPVAGRDAYPLPARVDRNQAIHRPDAEALAFLEGLLRALAETTEDELDSGRWTKSAPTANGARTYALALPDILDPGRALKRFGPRLDPRAMEREMRDLGKLIREHEFGSVHEINEFLRDKLPHGRVPKSAPSSELERAEYLMFEAFDSHGRRRVKLAREALRIAADCADAYVLLAERALDADRRFELYRQGMEAGQRALGPDGFRDGVGHFWRNHESRPYMRARFGYGKSLEAAERWGDAIEVYRDLLRLDSDDSQGARLHLAVCLLHANRNEEAQRFLTERDEEPDAIFEYARALVEFRLHGDSPEARRRLRRAVRGNAAVPKYLLGKEAPSEIDDSPSRGSDGEAVVCALALGRAWRETEGSLAWLKVRRGNQRRDPRAGKTARGKKRTRRKR